jgi:hypothetical protein
MYSNLRTFKMCPNWYFWFDKNHLATLGQRDGESWFYGNNTAVRLLLAACFLALKKLLSSSKILARELCIRGGSGDASVHSAHVR